MEEHHKQGYAHIDIRVSVGWRNPEEDAFDISCLQFQYKPEYKDDAEVLANTRCIDGYSNGSISTRLYDDQNWVDIYGRHNITIKEWTDYLLKEKEKDNHPKKDEITYRVHEVQNCKMVSAKASKIDMSPSIKDEARVQTFEATYRRPFIGHGLVDVELVPGIDYSLTSYFGCYETDKDKDEDGKDPDIFFIPY